MKNSMSLVLMAGMTMGVLGVAGCDEKKPEAAPATTLKSEAGKAVDAAKDAGAKAVDTVKDAGAKAVDAAKDAGAKAVDTVKDTGAKAVEAAKDAVKSTPAALTDDVKKTVTDYTSSLGIFGGLLESVKSPMDVAGKLSSIKDGSSSLSAAYATL